MAKLEEQLNEQVLNGTVSVNDQNLQQALIETAVLDDLNDVAISSPTNGQILQYDSADSTWKNENNTFSGATLDGVSIINSTLENNTVTTGTYSSPVNEALLIKARKASAGTITKGQVVYITGSSGTHLLVELAQANTEATSAYTIGIAATNITNTADGYIMQNGRLTGLSTLPTASFADGDTLYLSETTAGGYRKTIPAAPNHGVFLGFVVRASNGGAGEIDVRIDNYQELEELSDVNITGVAANNFLVRNATNTRWENATTSSVKTTLAINNVDNTSDANKPVSTAAQTALDNLELKTKIRNAGLINGFIRTTVASNNLTVAVSTSFTSQVDPTASNPVYVWIGGVLRSITSSLTFTRNGGTSSLNMGSAELATREVDLFPYLQWNTTTSAVNLLASRIPYARKMSSFVNSATDEKGVLGIVNYNSNDDVVLVDRFSATSNSSNNFTATGNVYGEPIYETRLLDCTATISPESGSFTNAPTVNYAKYQIIGSNAKVQYRFILGNPTGGGGRLKIKTPINSVIERNVIPSNFADNSTAAAFLFSNDSVIYLSKYDATSAIANSIAIDINGIYSI